MIAARLASIVPLLVIVAEIHAVVSAQSTQSPSANHGCVESMFLYVLNVCCGQDKGQGKIIFDSPGCDAANMAGDSLPTVHEKVSGLVSTNELHARVETRSWTVVAHLAANSLRCNAWITV